MTDVNRGMTKAKILRTLRNLADFEGIDPERLDPESRAWLERLRADLESLQIDIKKAL